jgi:hypothetical protein
MNEFKMWEGNCTILNCQKVGQDINKAGLLDNMWKIVYAIFRKKPYHRNNSSHTVIRTELSVTLSLNLEQRKSPHDASGFDITS